MVLAVRRRRNLRLAGLPAVTVWWIHLGWGAEGRAKALEAQSIATRHQHTTKK